MAIACRILLGTPGCKTGKLKVSSRNLSVQPVILLNKAAQTTRGAHVSRHQARSISSQPGAYVHPRLSYAFGRSNNHLIYTTLSQQIDEQARISPDRPAYGSYQEDKLATMSEFNQDVNRLAKALVQEFNIVRGDVIGVYAYNCYNWLLVQFASSRVGATLAPINPSYKALELSYLLKRARVKCLFLPGPKSAQAAYNKHLDVLQTGEIRELAQANQLSLRHVIMMDSENQYNVKEVPFKVANCRLHSWQETETDGRVFGSQAEADQAGVGPEEGACVIDPYASSPEDRFAIYFTSGTTGQPKGACVSHFAAINNSRFSQIRLNAGRPKNFASRVVTVLPLFHIFAGVLTGLAPLISNSTLILSGFKYDIGELVRAIIKHEANIITLTPTMLIDMLTYVERNKITGVPLKTVQSGGAHLPPEVATRTYKILPDLEELRIGYGSTENAGVATIQTLHEPRETKTLSVGSPMDFTEIRIVKPNTDEILPLGERGEIETRGYNTMTEYLDQPEKTAEVITPARWYRTGDIGLMHAHGSVQVCARVKQLIIKGGENVYPEEVQQLILRLQYVEDTHVVGVPDKRFGEQICAWVKLKPGFSEAKEPADRCETKIHRDDILDFCKANITYFKVPKYLLFVDEFPMTPTKKVQNHLMTEMSIKLLGLEDQMKPQ